MAFEKTIALPSGVSASYFRIETFRWDRKRREARAVFDLFHDATAASGGTPLVERAAKLDLTGVSFDTYLGPAALAAAEGDVLAQLYQAAKDACDAYSEEPQVNAAHQVICDFGAGVFADAATV